MSAKWTEHRLDELCKNITDGKHGDCQDEKGSKYFFLSAKDVMDGELWYAGAREITQVDFQDSHRRTNLEPGDILFTNSGTIGRMAIAKEGELTGRTTFQKSVAILKPDPAHVDPYFLYYLLCNENDRLSAFAAGTTQKNLLLRDLRQFKVKVPDLPLQRVISDLLKTVDEKIRVNRAMNETLEATARMIYKNWFVDFGPVREKTLGTPISGLIPNVADLFPDKLDSEGKPEGWRHALFSEIANSPSRGVNPQDVPDHTPYIGLEHMPRRSIALGNWEGAGKVGSNKSSFRKKEFLFGKLRPYFHKVGVAPVDGICSTDIVVVQPTSDDWWAFALICMSNDEFVAHTDKSSTGTKMPRTSWKEMGRFTLVLPDAKLAAVFNDLVVPMVDQIIDNVHQANVLTALNALLLPRLMSGELSLCNAEGSLGELL